MGIIMALDVSMGKSYKVVYDDQQRQGESGEELKDSFEHALHKSASDLTKTLSKTLVNNPDRFSQAISKAGKETIETKEKIESMVGKSEGQLEKTPLRDKLKLAELISHSPKMTDVAKWVGKFTQIAHSKQKLKYKDSSEQSGVESGDDLERLLPSELALYANQKTRSEFLSRYAEKETMQFEQKGKASLGQGSIVICLDQSGSMDHLENQSKGFVLALASIARRQKRNFGYIPFSSDIDPKKIMIFNKGKLKVPDLIKIATEFRGGGTNFTKPLVNALKIIDKDKFRDADIVFITDGKDRLDEKFIDEFNIRTEENNTQVLSLIIGGNGKNDIEKVSNRIINISDFTDEGSYEAFEI